MSSAQPVRPAETWARPAAAFDVERIRADFPIFRQRVYGRPLVYLDSAASAQKPQAVIDRTSRFYADEYASIHRGVHYLSEQATEAFEGVRATVRRFLNAADEREIVFVRGTTEAINLVAYSYGRTQVRPGDEIIISAMEHHSNIVPWQMIAEERGAVLRVIPITDTGELVLDAYERLLGPRTKLVAVVHVSNALGTINPVRRIIEMVHARGVPVLIDGAQAVPHIDVDVQALGCDFYAFSGHKLFGPTGIGVLYGRAALLEAMPPFQGGGSMISSVTFDRTLYNRIPFKFEAGTPDIAGALGLGAAIEYLDRIGFPAAPAAHERDLLAYATERLARTPRVRLVGTAPEKAGVLSFVLDDIHPHDIGTVLDRQGIAIRAGHHCAQPVMERFGIPATARASLAFYNTRADVDALIAGIHKVVEVLG